MTRDHRSFIVSPSPPCLSHTTQGWRLIHYSTGCTPPLYAYTHVRDRRAFPISNRPTSGPNAVVFARKMADPNGGVPYLQSYMSLVTHNASRFEYVPIEKSLAILRLAHTDAATPSFVCCRGVLSHIDMENSSITLQGGTGRPP